MNEEWIKKILKEEVNPVLAKHYGGAELAEVSEGIAWIRMTGACGTCPSAKETIETVVKKAIVDVVPGIKDVQLDMSVSEEMLDFARKILHANDARKSE